MTYRSLVAIVLAVSTVLCSQTAWAQQEDDEAYQEMLDLSNAAADAVADEQFALGAVQFRRAYDSYPDPVLLNNEMIAWYRADDCRNALRPARDFLELEDTDNISEEDRQNVRTVLVDCHLNLSEEAVEADNPALAAYHLDAVDDVERSNEEDERYQALRQQLDEQHEAPEPTPQNDQRQDADTSPNYLGWGQVSGGVLLAGLGMTFHSVALNRQSVLQDLEERGQGALLETRKEQWGSFQNTARWLVPTLYVAGAAAIGSGIYFVLSDSGSHTDASTAVGPSLSPEHAGVVLSGRF